MISEALAAALAPWVLQHGEEAIVKAVSALGRKKPDADPVNHPSHYTSHPSGVECITITEHMTFCVGNAVKYLWRSGLKGDTPAKFLEDLKKARWCIDREVQRLERTDASSGAPTVDAGPR